MSVKSGLLFLFFILALISPVLAQESLKDADFRVGTVGIGDRFDSEAFGKAEKIMGSWDGDEYSHPKYFFANGIVEAYEKIWGIYLETPALSTCRGLRPGENLSKAVQLYGEPYYSRADIREPEYMHAFWRSGNRGMEIQYEPGSKKIRYIYLYDGVDNFPRR